LIVKRNSSTIPFRSDKHARRAALYTTPRKEDGEQILFECGCSFGWVLDQASACSCERHSFHGSR
jgi:hypothetical protein